MYHHITVKITVPHDHKQYVDYKIWIMIHAFNLQSATSAGDLNFCNQEDALG